MRKWLTVLAAVVVVGVLGVTIAVRFGITEYLCEQEPHSKHEASPREIWRSEPPPKPCSAGRAVGGAFIWFDNHGEAFTALFTIVLALSTTLLWVATNRLWKSGEKQIAASELMARTTQQSVGIAQQSVEITQQTAKRQLRAYLSFSKVDFEYTFAPNRLRIQAVLTNHGQTPATNVRIGFACQLYDRRHGKPADPEVAPRGDGVTLNPGQTFPIREWRANLPPEQIDLLKNGHGRVRAYFIAKFVDAFGEERVDILNPRSMEFYRKGDNILRSAAQISDFIKTV